MASKIAKSAKLGKGTKVGEFCVVGAKVKIGVDCQIGNGVVIHDGSEIGTNVRIDDHTVVGKQPMRAANSAVTKEQELPPAKIGDNCIIGTSVVIYAGSVLGNKVLVADL